MENENQIFCKLLKKKIDIGLCADIHAVHCRMLKYEAVPEVEKFTREEVNAACDTCPYP